MSNVSCTDKKIQAWLEFANRYIDKKTDQKHYLPHFSIWEHDLNIWRGRETDRRGREIQKNGKTVEYI